MTPEGKVKKSIKEVLNKYGVYYFMPVQMGRGAAGLDMHCMFDGALAFFVEAKAPDKDVIPGSRQEDLINDLRKRGAEVFIVKDEVTLAELEVWLKLQKDSIDECARAPTFDGGIPISK